MKPKYRTFIGRFSIPHRSHRWLIEQGLLTGDPVMVMIRDVEQDDKNPFTAEEVLSMLTAAFRQDIEDGKLRLMIIPDVISVEYGRGVGYQVLEHKPPEDIKHVSATQIREWLRSGDDRWREYVLPGTEPWLEHKFGDA